MAEACLHLNLDYLDSYEWLCIDCGHRIPDAEARAIVSKATDSEVDHG